MQNSRAETRARYYIRKLSSKRGWDVRHPSSGGEFLEEQEIVKYFPDIGLGLDKPDFLILLNGEPVCIVEAKNDIKKLDDKFWDGSLLGTDLVIFKYTFLDQLFQVP